jgi:putative CocE/NonD family hydrolase
MGANYWLGFEAWPPPGIRYTSAYLRAGCARSIASLNGSELNSAHPVDNEHSDTYTYDPQAPTPSLLAYPELGPCDHQSVEGGMLTYTSAVLEHDLTIVGPVKAILYVASSAPDTDFVVRLCDVWPDGRSLNVCDGILRARYRTSYARPEVMVPGEVYRLEVDLWATAQLFATGHRLRVDISSSDFPRFDRNLNTGGPVGEEVDGRVAVNKIFDDRTRPSHVLLPVLDQPISSSNRR